MTKFQAPVLILTLIVVSGLVSQIITINYQSAFAVEDISIPRETNLKTTQANPPILSDSKTYNLVTKWGGFGNGHGQLNHPSSLDNDPNGTRFYIADLANNRIQVLNADGNFIMGWGTLGNGTGQFNNPGSIVVDEENKIVFVADIKNNRIEKFDSEGNYIAQWGMLGKGDSQFDHPGDMALDPKEKILYVTDIYNSRIQAFDYDGNFITKWGSFGTGDGQFNRPAGITIDPDRNLVYVTDTANNRIQVFDSDGNFVAKWDNGQFDRPDGIRYEPTGKVIYVADRKNHGIQVLDNQGTLLTKWVLSDAQSAMQIKPRDVSMDSAGKIYVVDKENNNILVYRDGQARYTALLNDTAATNSSRTTANVSRSDNFTKFESRQPFAPSLGLGNNTVSTAAVTIENGSSFPDNPRFYTPSNLTIHGNTTVTWTNNDTVLHTVTSGNPESGSSRVFDSSLIESNNQFNYTFTNEGQFEYYCTLHPFMTGKITVIKEIQPIVRTPDKMAKNFDVSIAEGSAFPSNRIFFSPPEVNLAPNATVVWSNNDSIIHSVTSGKPREGPTGEFDSGIIQPTNTFSHTFSKTGIYDYYSNLQPYMVGKIIVGLYTYDLKIDNRTYPISFLLTGDGNQLQKIQLQTLNPTLEIRMTSASPGNLTLVIPRALLDKLEPNGKDDAFGVIANRAVGFEETSTTPTSRTLVLQFDPGVNYIQIPGTKSLASTSQQAALVNTTNPELNNEIKVPRLNTNGIKETIR